MAVHTSASFPPASFRVFVELGQNSAIAHARGFHQGGGKVLPKNISVSSETKSNRVLKLKQVVQVTPFSIYILHQYTRKAKISAEHNQGRKVGEARQTVA